MNFSKRKPSARLLFTDTKSWVYKIRTDDVHKDFYEDKKQVIGKTKDEFKGEIISELGRLKSDGKEN